MQGLSIIFTAEPKDLEKILNNLSALQKIDQFTWKWNSNLGDIWVKLFENPYSIKISTKDCAPVTEERINKLAKRIKAHYPSCEIEYGKRPF